MVIKCSKCGKDMIESHIDRSDGRKYCYTCPDGHQSVLTGEQDNQCKSDKSVIDSHHIGNQPSTKPLKEQTIEIRSMEYAIDLAIERYKRNLIKQIESKVKNDKEWDKSHFITQKKGDHCQPIACSHCNGELEKTEGGWVCLNCRAWIDGKSYYQGRNSMRRDVLNLIRKAEQ